MASKALLEPDMFDTISLYLTEPKTTYLQGGDFECKMKSNSASISIPSLSLDHPE